MKETVATWTTTGSMATARNSFTAVRLANGKVLVAGGYGGLDGSPLASAELFNPATGSWALTGSMSTTRFAHTATLLSNGQVLVVGGASISSPGLASAELFNPATGTWTLTGSMHTARYLHTAALLSHGQVLVAGGLTPVGTDGVVTAVVSAELFNPATGTWTTTGSMNFARYFHTATLLGNGQVLVAGGVGCSLQCSSAELFTP